MYVYLVCPVLFVPIACVVTGFFSVSIRAFNYDPEITRGIPEETEEAATKAHTFRMHIRQFFTNGPRSIMPNDFSSETK
ncbi:MAG: hypothetical protein WDW38_010324 [Sanguina aurantia]